MRLRLRDTDHRAGEDVDGGRAVREDRIDDRGRTNGSARCAAVNRAGADLVGVEPRGGAAPVAGT